MNNTTPQDIEEFKPKNEKEEVNLWQDRVKLALQYGERVREEQGVPRFLQEYKGIYEVYLGNMQVPPINDVYAYTQASIAGLNYKNPYIAVNPRKTGTIQGSRILESAANYYWRELSIKEDNELEMIDVTLAGDAWHKTGTSVSSIGSGDFLKIKEEKLYSNRVSYKDIVFNIGSRRPPKDCRWMAQRIVRPTAEVKEEYGSKADGLKGGPHPSLSDNEIKTAQFKGDLNFSTLWEIWDAKDQEVKLIAEGHEKYLKEGSWPKDMDEYPFANLWFNAIPDEPFHMSDIKPWEPQILEKIKLLAMILNHVKRWNRQILMKSGSMKQTEIDKYEKSIDGTICEVDIPATQSINDVMKITDYGTFQADVWALIAMLDQIKNNVNGQPDVDRGAPQATKTRTLGELQYIKAGSKSRTDRKADRFECFLETIARHLIANMQANFDLEKTVKITGDAPQEIIQAFGDKFDPVSKSITFTKDDIQGEYDVDVRAGSTLPLDKETRMQILGQVLQQSVQLAQLPTLPPFIQVVISEILRDYDIKTLEIAFEQQKQQSDQMQQAGMQAKGVELDKVAAEADKRKAQAAEVRAKTAAMGAETLLNAAKEGVLPEAIEFGRGTGQFPMDNGNGM